MKCIKNESGKIKRVKDNEAYNEVKTGAWSYCPKSLWKEQKNKTSKDKK